MKICTITFAFILLIAFQSAGTVQQTNIQAKLSSTKDDSEIKSIDTLALSDEYYATFPTGLNILEQPNPKAKILGKIPYGERLNIVPENPEMTSANMEPSILDGWPTSWVEIKYKDKKGYVPYGYLCNFKPPILGSETLEDWAKQMKILSGKYTFAQLKGKNNTMNQLSVERQLLANGGVLTLGGGWEYHYTSILLPNTSVIQVLNAVKGLAELKELFTANTIIKTGTYHKTQSSDGVVWTIRQQESNGSKWLQGITIESTDEGYFGLNIQQVGTEVLITIDSGH